MAWSAVGEDSKLLQGRRFGLFPVAPRWFFGRWRMANTPDIAEALDRLEQLREEGAGDAVFTLSSWNAQNGDN